MKKISSQDIPIVSKKKDISWICSCKTGKRTLRCCSHVAALLPKIYDNILRMFTFYNLYGLFRNLQIV
ncbi:hypothetical protein BpHYR1_025557 [Brachionus plicatilis]|uniref:SWIM-type domain-containing protein n=1 Tax=Brachionus plicatilis TaxID=10195 RepID=A0A3M7PKW8_BRAPC|nr:hypothetical protein BpHYR1_025557 [Brachionus plicatilis]